MREDPRCPHCTEKVSATARWCMHCGRDFDAPVDAGSLGSSTTADIETAMESGDFSGLLVSFEEHDSGPLLVGIALGVVALFTLPFASPAGVTLWYLLAVVGIGYVAADADSVDAALDRGAKALALTPFLLVFVRIILSGFMTVSVLSLLAPSVYAALVLFAHRAISRR
ncbi:hypothetical protein ACOZ4I_01455 [Haloarcula salina]|uniref:hypothetical protein n=1 Tax=Haloarcula salina TaxID=1429914 RepID=UPI003C6F254C